MNRKMSQNDKRIFAAMWETFQSVSNLKNLSDYDIEYLRDVFAAGATSALNELQFNGAFVNAEHILELTKELENYWGNRDKEKKN